MIIIALLINNDKSIITIIIIIIIATMFMRPEAHASICMYSKHSILQFDIL